MNKQEKEILLPSSTNTHGALCPALTRLWGSAVDQTDHPALRGQMRNR